MQQGSNSDELLTDLVTKALLEEFGSRLVRKLALVMIALTAIQIVAMALLLRL